MTLGTGHNRWLQSSRFVSDEFLSPAHAIYPKTSLKANVCNAIKDKLSGPVLRKSPPTDDNLTPAGNGKVRDSRSR